MCAYIIHIILCSYKNKNLDINCYTHTITYKSLLKKIGFQVPPGTFPIQGTP